MQNQSSGEVGGPSRAVAFTVLGGAIGLFIGLVEQFTRSAWLRIDYGRNEFKEWSIDSAETYIGRSESATVPLRGDPNIQPIHAVIRKQGHDYVLADGGSQIGTLLNGQYIQQAVLVPGSFIQIGSNVLQFLMKGIPAPVAAPDGPRLQPLGPQSYANPQVATSGVYGSPQPQTAYPATPHQAPAVQPNPYPSAAPTPQPSNQTVAYSSPVGFSLVVLDGPLSGQRFPVNSNLEIGREGAQVRLTGDANASRRHAMVAPSTGSVRVTDLGSTNGTFINGQRLPAGDARPGDILKIGGTNFRVEAG
jgi:pSer/pThr/pTyr-binding forkhead associated (FHA) protein